MGGFAGRDGARPRARGGLRGAGAASRRPGWQAAATAAVGAVAALLLALIGSPSEAFATETAADLEVSTRHSSFHIATESEAEEIKTEESLEFPAEEGMDLSSSACTDSDQGL